MAVHPIDARIGVIVVPMLAHIMMATVVGKSITHAASVVSAINPIALLDCTIAVNIAPITKNIIRLDPV